jgi:hypothetical protein
MTMNSRCGEEGRNPDLVAIFWAAPEEALFNQKTIAAVLSCSQSKMERDRWAGTGIPYHKIGRRCLYRKAQVVEWIDRHSFAPSTSSHAATVP